MSRLEVGKRIAIAVVYVPLYMFILYPAALVIGLAMGAIAALWYLLTGSRADWTADTAGRIWSFPSKNMKWLMTGKGEFDLFP